MSKPRQLPQSGGSYTATKTGAPKQAQAPTKPAPIGATHAPKTAPVDTKEES